MRGKLTTLLVVLVSTSLVACTSGGKNVAPVNPRNPSSLNSDAVSPAEIRGSLKDVEAKYDQCLRTDDSNMGMKMCMSEAHDDYLALVTKQQKHHVMKLLKKWDSNQTLIKALQEDTRSLRADALNDICDYGYSLWYGGTGAGLQILSCYVDVVKMRIGSIKSAWQVGQGVNELTDAEVVALERDYVALKKKLEEQALRVFKQLSSEEKNLPAEDEYLLATFKAQKSGISKLRAGTSTLAGELCGLPTDPLNSKLSSLSSIPKRQKQIRYSCLNTVYAYAVAQALNQ
ncbi:MAG: hypothetical protein V4692_02665 [Bdellovibrionota bacterium]